jgi:hypothetical protein
VDVAHILNSRGLTASTIMGIDPLAELLASLEIKRQQLEAMEQGFGSLADSGMEGIRSSTDNALKKYTRILLDHHNLIVLLLSTQEVFKMHITALQQAIVELPEVKDNPEVRSRIVEVFKNANSNT